jgi:drug/metabolite transporter (DMT)-like permease
MSGSIVGFSLVAVAGRVLSPTLDTFEIMLYRSLVGIVLTVGAALALRQTSALRPLHLPQHLVRNLFHFAGQNLWLHALTLIPLAQLFALEFSYPILVALAAPLVLGEPPSRVRSITAAMGFAGVLIVARPFGAGEMNSGLIAAFLSAVGFAGAAIATKRLTRRVGTLAILFWLTMMQSLFGLLGAGHDGHVALPDPAILPWLLVIGVAGLGAHLGLTQALRLAPASVVTPIDFLRLPVIAVVGMAFYAEPIEPLVLLGGLLIFAANWIGLRAETARRAPPMA